MRVIYRSTEHELASPSLALRFASILGASFTVTDLSVTMDRPVVELFGVLAEGIAGRVLEDDGDRLRFRHDVIRDAIYEDMPATIRHGLHREAGQLLDRATEVYERLGAARDLARAEAVLRGAGIRRGRRGSRGRPQFGWDSLTPTERTVASLVAEGLSNPQIGDRMYISHRTVQTHLAHVFAKLGLTSRAQLAAEATRQEAP